MDNHRFSEREQDVLQLLLQGRSNKQMALELGIANRTVEFHLSNIYSKLKVRSRSEAILKLTEGQLRESTGEVQVKSTVAQISDSSENGLKSTLRSIPVKKLLFILGIFLAVIIAVVLLLKLPALRSQNTASPLVTPTKPSAIISTNTLVPTAMLQIPTASPTSTIHPTPIVIPPHTVNGYTATIESYYADISHLIFQVRITGGGVKFGDKHYYDRIGSWDIFDANGNLINSSGGGGTAIDPELFEFVFVPVTLFKGDHIQGQFTFRIENPTDHNQVLAQFRFDFDFPLYPDVRFYPKQSFTANGIEILLDSVTVTSIYTQVYLCFQPPSFAPWTIGNQTTLQIDGQTVTLFNVGGVFSAATGSYAYGEPYWVPPTKNGNCYKLGFQAGSDHPASLSLTIPQLEKPDFNTLRMDQLAIDYPGLTPRQAYYKYLEEHDDVYKGPWTFTVELKP